MINRKSSSSAALLGIDASRSISNRPTGTELYSRYLIEALIDQANPDYSFRLYFNQPPKSSFRNSQSAFRIIPFPRLWTHARLSFEMLEKIIADIHAPV